MFWSLNNSSPNHKGGPISRENIQYMQLFNCFCNVNTNKIIFLIHRTRERERERERESNMNHPGVKYRMYLAHFLGSLSKDPTGTTLSDS
jgi:hypothetical protein